MDFSIENILSPFDDKQYCLWFYYLSMIAFIILVILLGLALFSMFGKNKNKNVYFATFIVLLSYGVFYFQNRLLYSMCIKSI
jgi:hypothetical protein|tara:strand:- start:1219 stop:1464 length:246 start_codon:yes stop_codon:yes gene_type:complete